MNQHKSYDEIFKFFGVSDYTKDIKAIREDDFVTIGLRPDFSELEYSTKDYKAFRSYVAVNNK